MARPYDRGGHVPPAGTIDASVHQFWVPNPWHIVRGGYNLSAYERNMSFLNLGKGRFDNISWLTGTDHDGDGRAAICADIDNDGMQDLIVRQAGGAPILVFRNRFTPKNWLRVSLSGTRSNRLGIGARLTACVGDRRIVRELYPANTYASQQPCEAYFGLGDATAIDRLIVRWPAGQVEEFSDLPVNDHIRLTEGEPAYTLVKARRTTSE